jgi:hypothetical protein
MAELLIPKPRAGWLVKPTDPFSSRTEHARDRVGGHRIASPKNWFGVLFAIRFSSTLPCPAIEAEMIGRSGERSYSGGYHRQLLR